MLTKVFSFLFGICCALPLYAITASPDISLKPFLIENTKTLSNLDDANWSELANQPLSIGAINDMAVDTAGNIYLATTLGVYIGNEEGTSVINITPAELTNSGLSYITSIAVDTNNGVLYVGTYAPSLTSSPSIYQLSIADGAWTNISLNNSAMSVPSLDVDANGNLYAGFDNYYGVAVLPWQGTWSYLPKLSPTTGNSNVVYRLANNDGVLYAATDNGAYLFQNNAWTPIASDELSNITLMSMALDVDNDFLYLGTAWSFDEQNVYQYNLNTNELVSIPVTDFTDNTIYSLAVDEQGTLYAGVSDNDGVFSLPLGANAWQPAVEMRGGNPSSINSLLVNDNFIFAGSDSGLFQSNNLENSWSYLLQSSFDIEESVVGNNGILYVSTNNLNNTTNTYAYNPADQVWTNISNTLITIETTSISALATDAQGNLYMGTSDSGVFFLPVDGTGSDWTYTNTLPGGNPTINDLLIYNDIVFAATSSGIYSYTEGYWYNISSAEMLYTQFESLAIDTSNDNVLLYAGVGIGWNTPLDQNVYQCVITSAQPCNAQAWTNMSIPNLTVQSAIGDMVVDSNGNVYATVNASDGSSFALYQWSNNEWTSSATPQALPINNLVIQDDILYANAVYSVFESTDGGNTWSTFNTGLPTPSIISALAVDSANNVLYAAIPSYGLTDFGLFATDL